MTIREYIVAGLTNRLERLEEIGAPEVMIENMKKAVANPVVGGDVAALDVEIKTEEVKTGRGGKKYVLFNNSIRFFPNAKYGMYISAEV